MLRSLANSEVWDHISSAVQNAIAAIAIVVGGVWAYFRFRKERVYRPRLDVAVQAEELDVSGKAALLCRVDVKNIGAGQVKLVQKGTGLRSRTATWPAADFDEPEWQKQRAVPIFEEHMWIESGETIHHACVIGLPRFDLPVMLEVRLVCNIREGEKNVVVYSRTAVAPEGVKVGAESKGGQLMSGKHQTPSEVAENEKETDEWEKGKERPGTDQAEEDEKENQRVGG